MQKGKKGKTGKKGKKGKKGKMANKKGKPFWKNMIDVVIWKKDFEVIPRFDL